jgi:hypothetical protein
MSSERPTNHPEWRKENSLTAPSDRDPARTYRPNQSGPSLTEEQVSTAMKDLNVTSFIEKYPAIERRYADPPLQLQRFGLVSFVPAKGATPNPKGIYGFAKLRGNFATVPECGEQSEKLIRTVDSYHKIYTTYVGRPFPLTVSSDYSAETTEVDMRKDVTDTYRNDLKKKRAKEEKDMSEIKEREEALLAESTREEDDPELLQDTYITLRVKQAQLAWTYLETEKKMSEMKESILKTRKELAEMEEQDPTYKETYFKKYMDARTQAGLSTEQHGDNFIKFMIEDADLGF